MLKILTIVGARPQIIKAAAISRAVSAKFSQLIHEVIVHTGQHYDNEMSEVFFKELSIPSPHYNLEIGSARQGEQTAAMISGIEKIILKEKPACLIVYGDTNSTLAGALAASKLHVPVVHIEAGLRSFDKKMPEEINRIMADHVSTLLFTPTLSGLQNLINEGFKENNSQQKSNINHPMIYQCGDVMYDNSLFFSSFAENKKAIFDKYQIQANNYILFTLHRASNTDVHNTFISIIHALNKVAKSKNIQIVFPVHPRTKNLLEQLKNRKEVADFIDNNMIKIIPPVSFLEMIMLEKHCMMVATDSGGVQKEAFYFKKPAIILRNETEWTELVENGTCILVGSDFEKIHLAFLHFRNNHSLKYPHLFGDGKAAEFICGKLLGHFQNLT